MSIETTRLDDLGTQLGEAIAETPEYRALQETKAAVEGSQDVQDEITRFQQLRQEFMLARQTGEATQEDVQKLQQAQQELHQHPEMADYLEAQEELSARLEAVNEAISAELDVDFGSQVGGCCQD